MPDIEWKKVCCPVDFTEPSRAALRVAVDLCRRLGSELVLLHVDAAPRIAEELPRAAPIEQELEAWRQTAAGLGAGRVRVERTSGRPDVAIVEWAGANGADLVVMGTHGRVDREHMLTGSVAEGVVRSAPCPVLTVRAP